MECTSELSNGVSFDGNGFIGSGLHDRRHGVLPASGLLSRIASRIPDEVAARLLRYADQCLGSRPRPSTPTGISTTLTLSQRLTFDVVGEGMGGHVAVLGDGVPEHPAAACGPCAVRYRRQPSRNGQRQTQLTAGERALCDRFGRLATACGPSRPTSSRSARRRSASACPRVSLLPGEHACRRRVRLQGRNLFTHDRFRRRGSRGLRGRFGPKCSSGRSTTTFPRSAASCCRFRSTSSRRRMRTQ